MRFILMVCLLVSLADAGEKLFRMSDCYGKTTYARFDPERIVKIESANCTDKNGVQVMRVLVGRYHTRPYFMNIDELSDIIDSDEILRRDMKAQERKLMREQLLLDKQ